MHAKYSVGPTKFFSNRFETLRWSKKILLGRGRNVCVFHFAPGAKSKRSASKSTGTIIDFYLLHFYTWNIFYACYIFMVHKGKEINYALCMWNKRNNPMELVLFAYLINFNSLNTNLKSDFKSSQLFARNLKFNMVLRKCEINGTT